MGADLAVTKDPARGRWVWGVWDAYEGWFGDDAGGFAIPFVAFVGYRAPPFIATLGAGLNLAGLRDHACLGVPSRFERWVCIGVCSNPLPPATVICLGQDCYLWSSRAVCQFGSESTGTPSASR